MGRDRHDRRHKRSHRSTSPERVDDEEKHLRKTTAQQVIFFLILELEVTL